MVVKNYLNKIFANGSVMVLIITGCLYGSVMLVQASSTGVGANIMAIEAERNSVSSITGKSDIFTEIISIDGKKYKLLLKKI